MYENFRNAKAADSNSHTIEVQTDKKKDDRFSRYIDTEQFFKSMTLNDLRPFYNGTTLNERMAEIRKSIYYIRNNWGDFETLLQSLKEFIEKDEGMEFVEPESKASLDRLLVAKRDWLSDEEVAAPETLTYDAIRVYTSSEGYRRMYKFSNNIFRQADSVDIIQMIRNVTFMVELINIDLYNYCTKNPELQNFEGKVYRGMLVPDADIAAFKSLRNEPLNRRNIAVPLGICCGPNVFINFKYFHSLKVLTWDIGLSTFEYYIGNWGPSQ